MINVAMIEGIAMLLAVIGINVAIIYCYIGIWWLVELVVDAIQILLRKCRLL